MGGEYVRYIYWVDFGKQKEIRASLGAVGVRGSRGVYVWIALLVFRTDSTKLAGYLMVS